MCKKMLILLKKRDLLNELHPSSREYKNIIEESDELIDKNYEIYSYNKFIENTIDGTISFRNKVLIIDEIQNMVSEKGTYYEVLYNAIKNAPSSLRIVLLSATPMFDKPIEIALTMNLLKLPKEIPIGNLFNKTFIDIEKKKNKIIYSSKNLEYFKKLIKGRVSYFRGAPEVAFPKSEIKYVKCEMSDFQYKAYKTVKANENKNKSNKKIKKRGIFKRKFK